MEDLTPTPDPDRVIYACGGEIDVGEFCLRIASEDLDPDQITALLGQRPTDSHQRGTPFGKRGHIHKFGLWRFSTERLDFRGGRAFYELFDDFMRSLPSEPGVWQRITSEHSAEVVICVWMRTWNREFDISASALRELSLRNLSIHIDTYLDCPDDE